MSSYPSKFPSLLGRGFTPWELSKNLFSNCNMAWHLEFAIPDCRQCRETLKAESWTSGNCLTKAAAPASSSTAALFGLKGDSKQAVFSSRILPAQASAIHVRGQHRALHEINTLLCSALKINTHRGELWPEEIERTVIPMREKSRKRKHSWMTWPSIFGTTQCWKLDYYFNCLPHKPVLKQYLSFPSKAQVLSAYTNRATGRNRNRIEDSTASLAVSPCWNESWKPPRFLLRLPFPTVRQMEANTKPCPLKSID